MKKSELKALIKEVIQEITEDPNNPLYVEYISERPGEEPFMMGDQKFQFVNAKYPNGKKDIGVYAFSGDIVYGYQAFRQMHNLKEMYNDPYGSMQSPSSGSMKESINSTVVFEFDDSKATLSFDEVLTLAEKSGIRATALNEPDFDRSEQGYPEYYQVRIPSSGQPRFELALKNAGVPDESFDILPSRPIGHAVHENDVASSKKLSWKDGVSVNVDVKGDPIGYKSLGSLNSGIKLPNTQDWRRFFVSPDGNKEKYLSPKLKVWYDVDSSG
jgi:hypothetical protein